MRIVQWSFHNVVVPMIEDDAGELYCTSEVLCKVLGITPQALWKVASRHKKQLSENCMTNCQAIEYVRKNKEALGIKYLREDMRLWTETDMIRISMFSNSAVALEFQEGIIKLVKENARRGYVPQEQYQAIVQQLETTSARLDRLEELMEIARPSLQSAASAAGAALWAQRGTKAIREPN